MEPVDFPRLLVLLKAVAEAAAVTPSLHGSNVVMSHMHDDVEVTVSISVKPTRKD